MATVLGQTTRYCEDCKHITIHRLVKSGLFILKLCLRCEALNPPKGGEQQWDAGRTA